MPAGLSEHGMVLARSEVSMLYCMCLCLPRLSKKIHMRPSRFKLVFFVPKKSSRIVLDHLFLRFPNDLGMMNRLALIANCLHLFLIRSDVL